MDHPQSDIQSRLAVLIRPLAEAELPAAAGLAAEVWSAGDGRCYLEENLRYIREPEAHGCVYGAFSGQDRLIGAGTIKLVHFSYDVWGIAWLAVHPGCRRRGVASRLISALGEHALKHAGAHCMLQVAAGDPRVYEKNGFAVVHTSTVPAAGGVQVKYILLRDLRRNP